MNSTLEETIRIDASHPSLPGHFPGQPIVPGVVLLDRVAAAIESTWNLRVAALVQVKFLRALLPDQAAVLSIERSDHVRFRIGDATGTIASGIVELTS